MLRRVGIGPRIGEIDTAIRFDDDVVGPVELPSLEAVRDHGQAAVEFEPGHPPTVMFAGEQPPLQVAGQPVGAIGRLEQE